MPGSSSDRRDGRNVDLKAVARNPDTLALRMTQLAGEECERMRQHDVFFPVKSGRLKLRMYEDGTGELIHYRRDVDPGTTECRYSCARVQAAAPLRDVLSSALGVAGEVKKARRVWLVGQTRVHLDEVEGLGSFVELEVVLEPDQTLPDGRAIASEVADELGIGDDDRIGESYVDLLALD